MQQVFILGLKVVAKASVTVYETMIMRIEAWEKQIFQGEIRH